MLRKYTINNVLILSLVLLSILTGCKGDQEQADGRYFDFAEPRALAAGAFDFTETRALCREAL